MSEYLEITINLLACLFWDGMTKSDRQGYPTSTKTTIGQKTVPDRGKRCSYCIFILTKKTYCIEFC